MEYQIVLLPRAEYWVWLRACQKYVMTFGAGLTDDPGTAARYMAPRQVITLPSRRDAFPEIGNASRWLQSRYPGVRLDVVDADTPDDLRAELGRRVKENDRYGARRRKFYLLWPTDYAVVTQNFGANPQIYRRYALPGHEGVRHVGGRQRKAKEILWQARFIEAEEALALGLVNQVVPRAELEQATTELAERVAEMDPLAARMIKFSVNQAQDAMGFRTAVQGAHSNYMILEAAGGDRPAPRDAKGRPRLPGVERAFRQED